jgi:hypothetical protein
MTNTDPVILGSDRTSTFVRIADRRYRVRYRVATSDGGVRGIDYVNLWIAGRGWSEIATYSVTSPDLRVDRDSRRALNALKAHNLLGRDA